MKYEINRSYYSEITLIISNNTVFKMMAYLLRMKKIEDFNSTSVKLQVYR